MPQQPFIMPRGPLPFAAAFPLAALNAQQEVFMMPGGQMLVSQQPVQVLLLNAAFRFMLFHYCTRTPLL